MLASTGVSPQVSQPTSKTKVTVDRAGPSQVLLLSKLTMLLSRAKRTSTYPSNNWLTARRVETLAATEDWSLSP
jgi:hypothetical protein